MLLFVRNLRTGFLVDGEPKRFLAGNRIGVVIRNRIGVVVRNRAGVVAANRGFMSVRSAWQAMRLMALLNVVGMGSMICASNGIFSTPQR